MKWICRPRGPMLPAFSLLLLALIPAMYAQSSDPAPAKPPDAAAQPVAPASQVTKDPTQGPQPETQDKRVFGVFPNYRTTDGNVPFQPITSKQKILIGLKDSFDWPVYITGGAFAALYQIENQNPSFGQGMKGYARRYGTALADQVIGNMMTESFMPVLFHQDPRATSGSAEATVAVCTGRHTRRRVFSSAAPTTAAGNSIIRNGSGMPRRSLYQTPTIRTRARSAITSKGWESPALRTHSRK